MGEWSIRDIDILRSEAVALRLSSWKGTKNVHMANHWTFWLPRSAWRVSNQIDCISIWRASWYHICTSMLTSGQDVLITQQCNFPICMLESVPNPIDFFAQILAVEAYDGFKWFDCLLTIFFLRLKQLNYHREWILRNHNCTELGLVDNSRYAH